MNSVEKKLPLFSSSNPEQIELMAPSRLHFGLLPEENSTSNRRGGVGVMIDNPCLRMTASVNSSWQITGCLSSRVQDTVSLTWGSKLRAKLPLHIHVDSAPPPHAGFGSGTQISLGTAAILEYFRQRIFPEEPPLKGCLGRGSRSRVGSEGFRRGGLIYDPGTTTPNIGTSSKEVRDYKIPDSWRWLTVTCWEEEGLSGAAENVVFSKPNPDPLKRARLTHLIDEVMLPSLAATDFSRFSSALTEYGIQCGSTFSCHQDGLYRSVAVADVAARLKQAGVDGVGQSSWGPTIYGLFPNEQTLTKFVEEQAWLKSRHLNFEASSTNFTGARLHTWSPRSS